jgi:hypothetical protein
MTRVREIIKDTVELNLKSLSALLTLSKDYLRAVDGILRISGQPDSGNGGAAAEPRRAPILLVGAAGEEASGAFVLSNSAQQELGVDFAVRDQLGPGAMKLLPPSVSLAPGASAVIRLKVTIDPALEEGRDYAGLIFVPGFSNQVVDFVVRRLPHSSESEGISADTASAAAKMGADAR